MFSISNLFSSFFYLTANENGYQDKEDNSDGPIRENNEQPTVESLQLGDAQPSTEEIPQTLVDGNEGPPVENPETGDLEQSSVEDSLTETPQERYKEEGQQPERQQNQQPESQQPSKEVSQQEDASQTMTRRMEVPNNKVG